MSNTNRKLFTANVASFSGDMEIQHLKERLLETERAMAKIVEQMQQGIIQIHSVHSEIQKYYYIIK